MATHPADPALSSSLSSTASRATATPAAPSLYDEERAKDQALIRHTGKNRARITVMLAVVFTLASLLEIIDVRVAVTVSLCVVGLLANLALRWISERVYWRIWPHVAATLDSLLVSTMVFMAGKPILVTVYFLSIVPYALDRGAAVARVATLSAVVGFVAAEWLHFDVYLGAATPWNDVLLAALLLLLAAQQTIVIPARLERRMRRARERMAQVERGDLLARAPARHDDELGFLERSLNRMLDELLSVVMTVQREAESLVRVAAEVEGAVAVLRERGAEVAGGAQSLSEEAARQRVAVRAGMQEGVEASRGASDTREVALANRGAAQSMDAVMVSSRESIDVATAMLLRAGESVEGAADRVRRLAPASEQVGDFVARVSRIARQTNLLALNAAIEAARAGEEGAGFAVVADEIRALAVESAQAAKVIATTVQRVRDDMAEAVRAMEATNGELSGARTIAQEARSALTELVGEVAQVAARADVVMELAEQQAGASRSVVATFDVLEGVSQRVSEEARRAAEATVGQQVSIESLVEVAAELSASSQRLRAATRADWYRVMRAEAAASLTAPGGAEAVETPTAGTPTAGTVARPTPLRGAPLRGTPIRGTPIRRGTPGMGGAVLRTPVHATPVRPAASVAPPASSKAG